MPKLVYDLEFTATFRRPVEVDTEQEAQTILDEASIEEVYKNDDWMIDPYEFEKSKTFQGELEDEDDMDLDPEVKLADVQRYIPDEAQAQAALLALQSLGESCTYMPAGWITAHRRDFNVWLNYAMLGFKARTRVTFEEWCAAWLADSNAQRAIIDGRESA